MRSKRWDKRRGKAEADASSDGKPAFFPLAIFIVKLAN